MPKPVFIIGHRNPDTDSICSAIAYAHLKLALGERAVPARAGKINAETKFVLDYFGVNPPVLLNDLHPRVKDVMAPVQAIVHPWDTLRELGQVMMQHNVKSISVVDTDRTLVGVVTVGDLATRYFDELEMQNLSQAGVDYAGVLRALDGVLVCGADLERKVTGKVRIAAARSQTMLKVIKQGEVVLVGDRAKAQLACIEQGIACLIITGNAEVTPAVLEAAQRNGVIIIKAQYDTYTCARLINQSIPVRMIMQTKVVSFKPTDLLSDIKNNIVSTNYRNYPVLENGKLVGLINRDRLIVPEREKVILVDHNEKSQAIEGVEEAQILEIIDHHRLGGLQTSEPIFIRHEPVGSTATIIANMHWHRGVEIPKHIAGLLLAAVLSDTMLFKSPTATDQDRLAADKLADLAGLDSKKFGLAVLKAGAVLDGLSAADIVNNDLKEVHIGDYRLAIGQFSTMDSGDVLVIKDELLSQMEAVRLKEDYDMVLLMITGIINEATHLLYTGGPDWLINESFGQPDQTGTIFLPGVMSRKKQIIPPLVEASKRNP